MERNIYGSGPSLVNGGFFLDDLLCPEDEVTVQEQARGESGATSPTTEIFALFLWRKPFDFNIRP